MAVGMVEDASDFLRLGGFLELADDKSADRFVNEIFAQAHFGFVCLAAKFGRGSGECGTKWQSSLRCSRRNE
jgi:hypothetical protein